MQDSSELEDSNPVLQKTGCNQVGSAIFMKAISMRNKGTASHYGTVSTTALIIAKNGNITFREDRYKEDGRTKNRSLVKIENQTGTKINLKRS
jgi:uncharacterized protein with NRDE domain